jgi:hypothetical protein
MPRVDGVQVDRELCHNCTSMRIKVQTEREEAKLRANGRGIRRQHGLHAFELTMTNTKHAYLNGQILCKSNK